MKISSSFLKSIVLFAGALIVFLSLISYNPHDVSSLAFPAFLIPHNFVGIIGTYISLGLFFLFGYAAYFFPVYILLSGFSVLGFVRFGGVTKSRFVNAFSFCFFLVFLSSFIGIFFEEEVRLFDASGMAGFFLTALFKQYLGVQGSFITISILTLITSFLVFGFFLIDVLVAIKSMVVKLFRITKYFKRESVDDDLPGDQGNQKKKKSEDKNPVVAVSNPLDARKVKKELDKEEMKNIKPEIKMYTPKLDRMEKEKKEDFDVENIKKIIDPVDNEEERLAKKKKKPAVNSENLKQCNPADYVLPLANILKVPTVSDNRQVKEDIEVNIKNLEETLTDFGVEAKVVSVQKGPVVTMYELKPIAGVKIQKISALADDIALAMKSAMVRVVAPLPGRGTVGIEIPNDKKNLVVLREVLEEKEFINSPSKLTFAIGKDVSGNPVVADIKDMPHLLIAGATGAGKTVCVNSLICSILLKAKPDEVKFILVDPKMVELASFDGIPHLLHPIITEAKKAFIVLNWAVEEMERRYRLLANAGVRNIDSYNKGDQKLPFIVIVVDELADLMIVARESVETAIQRLAQLSRAVGIHLVLATQRPSVDVITGVIKANFPARISFKVASKVDSRTVLDAMGADKLLGKGDLLFLKPGAVKLIRAQGCLIDDEDIEKLMQFIRNQGGPVYETGITEIENRRNLDLGSDELLDEALRIVLQTRQASASLLQRRLRVGYTRAARLLDIMEQEGVVGPFCGSKAREILVEPEKFLVERNLL